MNRLCVIASQIRAQILPYKKSLNLYNIAKSIAETVKSNLKLKQYSIENTQSEFVEGKNKAVKITFGDAITFADASGVFWIFMMITQSLGETRLNIHLDINKNNNPIFCEGYYFDPDEIKGAGRFVSKTIDEVLHKR